IKRLIKSGWRAIVAILLFILLWEVAVKLFQIEAWFLPAPSLIGREFLTVWPTFYPHLMSTLFLSVIGIVIVSTVGLIVAMILHLFKNVRKTFYPFLILSQNIPIIVLAPLLVIWFGFGAMPKFIIIHSLVFSQLLYLR